LRLFSFTFSTLLYFVSTAFLHYYYPNNFFGNFGLQKYLNFHLYLTVLDVIIGVLLTLILSDKFIFSTLSLSELILFVSTTILLALLLSTFNILRYLFFHLSCNSFTVLFIFKLLFSFAVSLVLFSVPLISEGTFLSIGFMYYLTVFLFCLQYLLSLYQHLLLYLLCFTFREYPHFRLV
jgi:hypothetical protein